MTGLMVMELISMQTVQIILASGSKTNSTDKAKRFGQMVQLLREPLLKVKSMVTEHLHGLTHPLILAGFTIMK